MHIKVSDIIKYNTDVKISGNLVEFKHYKEKNQLKGYNVDVSTKESTQAKYERLIAKVRKEGVDEKVIAYLMQSMENTIKENKVVNFEKSNRRAKDMVMDLVACNHDLFSAYDGTDATLKFLTLSFDPKKYDSDFEEYEISYRKNKDGQMYPVEKPVWGLGSRKLLKDYKHCYGEITKFFKRLSFKLYGENKNVIKYLCVPELHKSDEAFHFHIILFNMPYLAHADYMSVWDNGGVYIEKIPSGSAGTVAKYVAKYLTKSHDEKNASFEQYEKIGMENMKRYSCSRGLKRPIKRSITLTEEKIEKLIDRYIEKDWLEVVNKEKEKYRKVEIEAPKHFIDGKDILRGDQVIYSFRVKNVEALNALMRFVEIEQRLNTRQKTEYYRKLKASEKYYLDLNGMTEEYIDKKVKSLRDRQKLKGIDPRDTTVDIDYANCLVGLKPVL